MLLLSCRDPNGGDSGAPAVSQANVRLTAPSGANVNIPPQNTAVTVCRIIGANGDIHRDLPGAAADAGAVASGDVAGDTFFNLMAGSKLSVKNGTTTREMIFEGPGDVRVCVGGEEEMWLTGGTFGSVVGAGESPGAEVWVATPHGVIRYGSAAHVKLTVAVSHAEVQLASGGAWIYAADTLGSRDAGATRASDGWYQLAVGSPVVFASKKAPSQILGDCEQAAKAARDLAAQITTHDASLAEAAPRHVVLRQKAHALCAIAELVAARSFDPVERERLLPRAHAASAKWRDSAGNP